MLGRGTNIAYIFKHLVQDYSVHTTSFLLGGGRARRGFEPPTDFQKVGLDSISNFRGRLLGKRGGTGDFESTFFCLTKKKNWEILTKNLVIFRRWNGVKDGKF